VKLSRDTALKIHWLFDQLIPPILRDTRWFMKIPLTMAFRHRADVYLDFKAKAFQMSEQEYRDTYRLIGDVMFERETDLNHKSIELIFLHLKGKNILEVGCGKGFLCKKISEKYSVTAADIVIQEALRKENPQITFHEANIEQLPFTDQQFDTVVCTHTLEHVRNLSYAVNELRRVARRVIIVVPRQRPYLYTFDLHLNFFPYPHSLLSALGRVEGGVTCEDADGDLFYMEDVA